MSDRAAETCDGIDSARATIERLIDTELASPIGATTPARLVVGGFSQGGALALHCGLGWERSQPPAGVLCMSGYLPLPR